MTRITWLIPEFDSPMKLRETKLRRDLDIVRRARADGAENLPRTGQRDLSEPELEIVTHCERACDDVKQWLLRRLRGAAEGADAADPTPEERDFEGTLEDTRLGLTKLRSECREQMITTRLEERRLHREYKNFRRQNRLSRGADYPDVPVLAAGGVTLVFAIETWLNARVFAEASDFGLVGGALLSALVSVPNISIGLLVIGLFGLRHMLHVDKVWRYAGMAATALGAVAVTFHNLYFAHYRALLSTDPNARLLDAWRHLVEQPLGFLADKDAWTLFVVGMVAALISAWKGRDYISDRYPGFARVDRRYRMALKAYEAAVRHYRDAVHRLAGKSVAVIDQRIGSIERRFKQVSEAINRAHVDIRTADQAVQENARVCARILKTYRDENSRVRTTRAPMHFSDIPALTSTVGELPAFDLEGKRGRLHERVETTRRAAAEAKSALRRMAEAETEEMLTMSETVEAEAERRAQSSSEEDSPVTTLQSLERPELAE